ncbi:unnamed protein product, partial [Mycena citricolor]
EVIALKLELEQSRRVGENERARKPQCGSEAEHELAVSYLCIYGTHLFLGVSTDLIVSAPLVPGSFTYSSFGGGIADE